MGDYNIVGVFWLGLTMCMASRGMTCPYPVGAILCGEGLGTALNIISRSLLRDASERSASICGMQQGTWGNIKYLHSQALYSHDHIMAQ